MPSSRKNQRKNRRTRNLNFETLESRRLLSVNGPGVSDPALFDTVINFPFDISSNDFDSNIGGVAAETVQLNIADGGSRVQALDAPSGIEVNISGGEIISLEAFSGSEVNISGGRTESFTARAGSDVTISGGSFSFQFRALNGSNVELIGGEFELNGESFSGTTVSLDEGESLSGLLQDGTGFIISPLQDNVINDITLTTVPLPAVNPGAVLIDSPNSDFSFVQQTVTIVDGGRTDNHPVFIDSTLNLEGGSLNSSAAAIDSTINISGGFFGNSSDVFDSVINLSGGFILALLDVSRSEVNISGGFAGSAIDAFDSVFNISGGELSTGFDATDSEINISGGMVDRFFDAKSGSVINVRGGEIGGDFDAESGSEINVRGGSFGDGFRAFDGSEINISGGEFTGSFTADLGSEVNFIVQSFAINGVPQLLPASSEVFTIDERDIILTGEFDNGQTFSFDLSSESVLVSPDATLTIAVFGSTVLGAPTDVTVLENTASDLDLSSLEFSSFSPFGSGRVQVGIEVSEGTLVATSNNDVSVSGSGTGELTLTGLVENLNLFFDDASSVQFTGPAGVSGEDAVNLTLKLDDDSPTIVNEINIDITPLEDDPNIIGTSGDDILEATGDDGTLVGGIGSDTLIGSNGNDVFTTDQINGDNDRNDQDVINLGNVDGNDTGNDVVTDFDVNGANGGENNFDTLQFIFNGEPVSLSSRNEILEFVALIESDGDRNTDALVQGDDLIFVFGRDSDDPGIITSSVTLENVVGQNGLNLNRLINNSADDLGVSQLDVFSAAGNVDVGQGASDENFQGGDENDVIVGGLGSDFIVGGGGNDILTGDQTDSENNRFDQDVFAFGDIAVGGSGNDVITDFDTDNFNGGERNFDTLQLSIGNEQFSLSTGNDFLNFANLLESDGNAGTGTLIDGDDLIFVFSRNADGLITDSIRLKDIIEQGDGLTDSVLADFDRIGESDGIDIFV